MRVYWYELTLRGVSPGAYPRGAFTTEINHVNYKGKDYGAVAYIEPLSAEQIDNYELKAIYPPRELYDYERKILNVE
ncbi:hypothetical protein [Salmonella enterica]|uniref:defense against restriction DarA-related protein n=1 Tax=Salmonella enterica TaxID=28901 RepID=UPI000C228533|nr:hypothetical protein [Salmonella enterica]PJH64408.1 hypothetical protein CVR98_24810 [Salmonella enterica subsp. enterica serovar Enteritidis]